MILSPLDHEKRKPCFTDVTDPDFSFQYIIFFYSLLKLCKTSHFWSKRKKKSLKFWEISGNLFSNFFSKKCQTFGKFFKESHFYHQKEKMLQPTNPTWKVCPSINKVSFFHGLYTNSMAAIFEIPQYVAYLNNNLF